MDTLTTSAKATPDDKAWAELPREIRQKSVDALKAHFDPEATESILRLYNDHGPDGWYAHARWHFTVGAKIRNFLRKNAADDMALPSGNWDDYYVQAIEAAVGVRATHLSLINPRVMARGVRNGQYDFLVKFKRRTRGLREWDDPSEVVAALPARIDEVGDEVFEDENTNNADRIAHDKVEKALIDMFDGFRETLDDMLKAEATAQNAPLDSPRIDALQDFRAQLYGERLDLGDTSKDVNFNAWINRWNILIGEAIGWANELGWITEVAQIRVSTLYSGDFGYAYRLRVAVSETSGWINVTPQTYSANSYSGVGTLGDLQLGDQFLLSSYPSGRVAITYGSTNVAYPNGWGRNTFQMIVLGLLGYLTIAQQAILPTPVHFYDTNELNYHTD